MKSFTCFLLLWIAGCAGSSSTGPNVTDRTILFTNASSTGYSGGAIAGHQNPDGTWTLRLDEEFHLDGGTQRCVRFRLAQLQGDSTVTVSANYDGANFVWVSYAQVGTIANWSFDGNHAQIATAPC